MKNIISIVVLMITLFSTSVIQAVETKYIPSASQAVFSIKLNDVVRSVIFLLHFPIFKSSTEVDVVSCLQ